MLASQIGIDPRIALGKTGLVLGAETRLALFADASERLAVDQPRLEALFTVAFKRAPSHRHLSAIDTAATHWQGGDKALANLRLVFADLPRLQETEDVVRLKAAELLFDTGLRADHLAELLDADPPRGNLDKYDPNQPRVPAGSGKESGRWTALWHRFSAWLDEEVPEYDLDTGDEVGTRSRAKAILTNPATMLAGGAAVLFGGEVVLGAGATIGAVAPEVGVGVAVAAPEAGAAAALVAPEAAAAAIAPVVDEAQAISPFAQRYLSVSGGRLGSTSTRQQLYDIAQDFASLGEFPELGGDGQSGEEFIRGPGPGTKGGTYVDFTARAADGSAVRIQTIDTLADGMTPTKSEAAAASRIRAAFPNDRLYLIPKRVP